MQDDDVGHGRLGSLSPGGTRLTLANRARSRFTAQSELTALTRHPDNLISRLALENPRLPAVELRAAFERGPNLERGWMLRNPNLPEDLLARLAELYLAVVNEGTRERWVAGVLTHRNVSRDLLLMGLESGNEAWVLAVARNPALPADLADRLLRTGSTTARVYVSQGASAETLSAHQWEKERSVQMLREVLRRTAANAYGVSDLVWESPDLERVVQRMLLVAHGPSARLEVARYTQDAEALLLFCQDENKEVRAVAIRNSFCPDEGRVFAALLA